MKKAVLLLSWVVVALPCAGEIIIVDDGGYGDFDNVQAAIDDSNDGDIIYVFPGTYTGSGNFNIDYGGRAITVTGVDPQDPYIVAATVIDCNSAGRGFYFHSAEDANSVLAGLKITNGYADYGGGLRCNYTSPTITNCIIAGNSAGYSGGGVYCYSSDPTITGCAIGGNSSNTDGGGMYEYGSTPNISNCEFVENSASRWGGGMYARGGVPRLTACTFYGNAAENGGGIYSNESDAELKSCALTGNTAAGSGGGLYCDESGPVVSNCTFSSNVAEAGSGGGILSYYAWVRNSILWDNNDNGGSIESAQISGATSQVYFSCIQDDDPNDANIPFGGADNNNIDDNPMFVRDPNAGGDAWGAGGNDDFGDLHLESSSPCINAGEPFARIAPGSLDMDGEPRVMGPVVDMGADEYFMKMLAVTEPEGGEVWTCHSWHQIVWVSDLYEGNVDIVFSANDGNSWQSVESNLPDTGSYMWELPGEVDSNQCVIAVVPSVADPNVICIDSGVFTIHPDSAGPPVTSKWESLGGDYDRMGLSENYGPVLGCVKWEFEVDGAISASVTIGPNETVYVPCEDGNLYKLDANGVVLWTYEANSPLISSASIGSDGTVYVGADDEQVHAVDINGNLRWTHSTGGRVYSSPAVSPDGNSIYVGSQDGKLYALGRDGSELWSFETDGLGITGGAILSSPAIGSNGTVYVAGFYDPNLYALDPNNGSVKWVCHFDSNGWPFASPVVAPDGTVYQMLVHDANLYAIEPNDGGIRWATNLSDIWRHSSDSYSRWFEPYYYSDYRCWLHHGHADAWYFEAQYNVSESAFSQPVIGPDGTIYASLDDPYVRAVEPNGTIKWIRKPGARSIYAETDGEWGWGWYDTSARAIGGFGLTVGSNGSIYAAGNDSNLYVISPDGFEVARFDSNDYSLGFPVVSADNTLIVGDSRDNSMLISYENNKLWAIGGDDCQGQDPNLYWQGGAQDLDGDGKVDSKDLKAVADCWLKCTECCPSCPCETDVQFLEGDINRDYYVNFLDFATLAQQWLAGY